MDSGDGVTLASRRTTPLEGTSTLRINPLPAPFDLVGNIEHSTDRRHTMATDQIPPTSRTADDILHNTKKARLHQEVQSPIPEGRSIHELDVETKDKKPVEVVHTSDAGNVDHLSKIPSQQEQAKPPEGLPRSCYSCKSQLMTDLKHPVGGDCEKVQFTSPPLFIWMMKMILIILNLSYAKTLITHQIRFPQACLARRGDWEFREGS
uniref:Uncharacterized protein n=1 Tax=Oryza punctata TaxID=4537 RepID=A0A0E0MJA3_ORYPU